MDIVKILSSSAALVFVLCLIAVISMLLRKYSLGISGRVPSNSKKRLHIKEVLNIDAKKKIVLITRDDKEHLIAFSDNAVEVVEKDINKAEC